MNTPSLIASRLDFTTSANFVSSASDTVSDLPSIVLIVTELASALSTAPRTRCISGAPMAMLVSDIRLAKAMVGRRFMAHSLIVGSIIMGQATGSGRPDFDLLQLCHLVPLDAQQPPPRFTFTIAARRERCDELMGPNIGFPSILPYIPPSAGMLAKPSASGYRP